MNAFTLGYFSPDEHYKYKGLQRNFKKRMLCLLWTEALTENQGKSGKVRCRFCVLYFDSTATCRKIALVGSGKRIICFRSTLICHCEDAYPTGAKSAESLHDDGRSLPTGAKSAESLLWDYQEIFVTLHYCEL